MYIYKYIPRAQDTAAGGACGCERAVVRGEGGVVVSRRICCKRGQELHLRVRQDVSYICTHTQGRSSTCAPASAGQDVTHTHTHTHTHKASEECLSLFSFISLVCACLCVFVRVG